MTWGSLLWQNVDQIYIHFHSILILSLVEVSILSILHPLVTLFSSIQSCISSRNRHIFSMNFSPFLSFCYENLLIFLSRNTRTNIWFSILSTNHSVLLVTVGKEWEERKVDRIQGNHKSSNEIVMKLKEKERATRQGTGAELRGKNERVKQERKNGLFEERERRNGLLEERNLGWKSSHELDSHKYILLVIKQ